MSESMVSIERILANRQTLLASANKAHANFIAALRQRDHWTNRSNDPLLLELHRVVSTFMTLAEKGQLGHHSKFDLRAMHRMHRYRNSGGQEIESSSTEFEWFSMRYKQFQDKVDYWGQQLEAILENQDFLQDFNDDAYIPPELRLNYCTELLYGLDQCNAGRKYFEKNVASEETETSPYLPVCVYTRIPDFGNLDTDKLLETLEQSGVVAAFLAKDLIPFLAKVDPTKVKDLESRVLSWARKRGADIVASNAHEAVEWIRDLSSSLPAASLSRLAPAIHGILLAILTAQFANTYGKIMTDASWRDAMNLAEDFGDIFDALASTYELLPERSKIQLGKFAPRWFSASVVQRLSAGLALVNGAWSAAEGIEDEEYEKAAFAGVKVLGSAILLISPAGPFWAVALGTALLVTGELGIASSEISQFEKWFSYNYFGKDWNDVNAQEPWDRIYFKWRRYPGQGQSSAHFARQISELYSLSEDRHVKIVSARGPLGGPSGYQPFYLKVRVNTRLAYKRTTIVCVSVYFGYEARMQYLFRLLPWSDDYVENQEQQRLGIKVPDIEISYREEIITTFVVEITVTWGTAVPWFVEVELCPSGFPGEIDPEDIEKLPNVLRARAEVEWT